MSKRKPRKAPPVGATFEGNYKGKKYTLEIVTNNGEIRFKSGKKLFGSPSGAAKAITKREVNGWGFWGMD